MVAARFDERRVLVLSTLPPDILLPGDNVSQEVKCFSVGHRLMSVPHSPMSFKAVLRTEPVNLAHIRTQHLKEHRSDVKLGFVSLPGPVTGLRKGL